MQKTFSEMVELMKKLRKEDLWTKQETVEKHTEWIIKEIEEIKQAVENKDFENLKEELGDVFWDVLMTAIIAEESGFFKAEDIMKSKINKMRKRMPHIFDENFKGDVKTMEDRLKIWKDMKEK